MSSKLLAQTSACVLYTLIGNIMVAPPVLQHPLRNKLQTAECTLIAAVGIYSVACVVKWESHYDIAH